MSDFRDNMERDLREAMAGSRWKLCDKEWQERNPEYVITLGSKTYNRYNMERNMAHERVWNALLPYLPALYGADLVREVERDVEDDWRGLDPLVHGDGFDDLVGVAQDWIEWMTRN